MTEEKNKPINPRTLREINKLLGLRQFLANGSALDDLEDAEEDKENGER